MGALYNASNITNLLFLLISFVGSFTTKIVSFKNFWDYNSISSFSFLPSKPSYTLLPALLHIRGLSHLSLIVNCIYTYVHMCIPKYNLSSQYNVNCKYVFRDDSLPNIS